LGTACISDESSAAGKFQGQATRVDGSMLGRAYRTDLVMGNLFSKSACGLESSNAN
jgi:hypothetical protein